MSLYYSDDLVTLHLGDCLTETAWLGADVLVTDPPYWMGYQSNNRRSKLDKVLGDHDTTARDSALSLWGTRPALMFGRWSVASPDGEVARLIWWKSGTPGMGNLALPWGPAHEDIHVLGSGWDRESTGVKRDGSVIRTTSGRGSATGEENRWGHPTPKPVDLMAYLITRCPPGVIADPFAGVGATLVAAKQLGRRAIGVEMEERYCEVIAGRLAQGAFIFEEDR